MDYQNNFIIENDKDIIDEFIKKYNIAPVLDELYELINLNLTIDVTPKLELYNPMEGWTTLFIKIQSNDDYSVIGDFYTKFIDTIVKYPSMVEYLNIDIIKEEKESPLKTIDCNELTLDQMVDYLKKKHEFSSSGETKCILSLIHFYEKNKNSSKVAITDDQIKSIIELTSYEDSSSDVWGKDTYLGTMDELIKKANLIIKK